MRVLVTGATGIVGSALTRLFLAHGYHVTCVSRSLSSTRPFNGETLVASIEDYDAMRRLLNDWRGDAVVHCAAIGNVELCERDKDDAYRVNVLGTRNTLAISEAVGARLVFVSTGSVFSGRRGGEHESCVPDPANYYGITKALAEEIVKGYSQTVIVRAATILGVVPQRRTGQNFAEWILESAKADRDVGLFSDVRTNPVSSATFGSCVLSILASPIRSRILHVGSQNVVTKLELGKLILAHYPNYRGRVEALSVDESALEARRPVNMNLNVDLFQREYWSLPKAEEEVDRVIREGTTACA